MSKKKRRGGGKTQGAGHSGSGGGGGGGGVMQSMLRGFRSMARPGSAPSTQKKKMGLWDYLTWGLLVAAIAFLLYKYLG